MMNGGCTCPGQVPCPFATMCERAGTIVPCMMAMQGKFTVNFGSVQPNKELSAELEKRGWIGSKKGTVWSVQAASEKESQKFTGQCPYENPE